MKTRLCSFIFMTVLVAPVLFCGVISGHAAEDKTNAGNVIRSGKGKTDYCIECHRKMGNSPAIIDAWEKSVHGKTGTNCNLCHGGNETINDSRLAKMKHYGFIGKPGKRNVSDFCGREQCHGVAFRQFQKSPHYGSVKRTGEPSCISCHGVHNIQRSSINIISDKTCSRCHPVEYSREIISSIFTIEKNLQELQADLDYLESKKISLGNARENLNKTRSLFHQMVHVFSREEIQFTRKLLELEIKILQEDMTAKKNSVRRMDLVFIFTLIFSIVTTISIGAYSLRMLAKRKKTD